VATQPDILTPELLEKRVNSLMGGNLKDFYNTYQQDNLLNELLIKTHKHLCGFLPLTISQNLPTIDQILENTNGPEILEIISLSIQHTQNPDQNPHFESDLRHLEAAKLLAIFIGNFNLKSDYTVLNIRNENLEPNQNNEALFEFESKKYHIAQRNKPIAYTVDFNDYGIMYMDRDSPKIKNLYDHILQKYQNQPQSVQTQENLAKITFETIIESMPNNTDWLKKLTYRVARDRLIYISEFIGPETGSVCLQKALVTTLLLQMFYDQGLISNLASFTRNRTIFIDPKTFESTNKYSGHAWTELKIGDEIYICDSEHKNFGKKADIIDQNTTWFYG